MRIRAALLGIPGAFSALLLLASACGGGGTPTSVLSTPTPSPAFGLRSDVVASANHVSALAFAPDGRIFLAEQYSGQIRVISADGKMQSDPFATLEVANWLNLDWGLTGLALDPDFQVNHYLYAFYTIPVQQGNSPIGQPALVRFTDQNGHGAERTVILSDLPQTLKDHQGFKANGKIHFGADRLLYMTIGDYDYGKTPGPDGKPPGTDLSTPMGKMLRINKDGTVPPDNPLVGRSDADPRIFAYGFSTAFEFAVDPASGRIYGTDADASCEGLNLMSAGGNYGWPDVGDFPFSDCNLGRQVKPIHLFAIEGMKPGDFLSGVVPTGLAFAPVSKYPAMGDSLLVCESKSSELRQLKIDPSAPDKVSEGQVVVYDCKGTVARSPDGSIYYTNDTEIRRLVQASASPPGS